MRISLVKSLRLFACPKGFDKKDNAATQINAIRSWLTWLDGDQITLVGEDPGVKEITESYGLRWAKVETNDLGTPFIESMFRAGEQSGNENYLCYINSDILMFPEICDILTTEILDHSLIVGTRWDLEKFELSSSNISNEPESTQSVLLSQSREHARTGIDYFIYPRGTRPAISRDLLLGRNYWDHHLIYLWNQAKLRTIDVSGKVRPIHVNHNYEHIANLEKRVHFSPEFETNKRITRKKLADLDFTTHFVDSNSRVRKNLRRKLQAYIRRSRKRVFDYIVAFGGITTKKIIRRNLFQ